MSERFSVDGDIETGPERKETPAILPSGNRMPVWTVTRRLGGHIVAAAFGAFQDVVTDTGSLDTGQATDEIIAGVSAGDIPVIEAGVQVQAPWLDGVPILGSDLNHDVTGRQMPDGQRGNS